MKVYFETYGCTMNQGDTEIMKGIVAGKYEIVEEPEKCDIAVLNSCGVIQHTENKIVKRQHALKRKGKKVLITGCLPRINFWAVNEADGILSPRSLNLICEALQAVSKGRKFISLGAKGIEKTSLPKQRKKGVIAIVPISEGCAGRCSYCATIKARGRLKSFSSESVVCDVKKALDEGYREIQLTAQDTACYGNDTGESLPELLQKILELPGDFRVRIGMMNPKTALPIFDDLLDCFSDEKLYKFLHLPVQSGDNTILECMNRGYSAKDFAQMATAFKKFGGTLSTDVIVGYPGEDHDSFMKTYKLIEKVKPDILNIKRFSPRPGTKASKLKDMPDRIKKERSRMLTKLHRRISLEQNKRLVGEKLTVLITEEGKNKKVLSRTDSYKQVVLDEGILGDFRTVKIRDATPTYLIA